MRSGSKQGPCVEETMKDRSSSAGIQNGTCFALDVQHIEREGPSTKRAQDE